jgi:hypothetical protein
MTRRRASLAPRDQATSAFSGILLRLCDTTSSLAAALVDKEGETVDYAGFLSPYDTRVTAAELQILVKVARQSRSLEGLEHLITRAERRTYSLIALSEGYVLVLVLARCGFNVSRRAVAEAVRELEAEAGLTYASGTRSRFERWSRVEVRTAGGNTRRPEAIWLQGAWQKLVILGRFHSNDLRRREVGFRARLPSGVEFALVREPLGKWFAEDL